MKFDTTITENDLNGIDALNGSGSVSNRDESTFGLKGALNSYNKLFNIDKQKLYVRNKLNQMEEYLLERFEYKNIPNGLDKYKLEKKLIKHGSAAIIKIGEMFLACAYTIIKFDMYELPSKIKINEPRSKLNGRIYNVNDIAIIRDNIDKINIYQKSRRYIEQMEKILFQLEKNLFTSAPKGIIDGRRGELKPFADSTNLSPMENALETMSNSPNTFFTFNNTGQGLRDTIERGNFSDEIFIPIEFTDRTENLIKQYDYLDAKLKELVGAPLEAFQKSERNTNADSNKAQGFGISALQHAFNIRKNDIENLNKQYKIDLQIEMNPDIRPEDEMLMINNNTQNNGGDNNVN